MKFDGAIKGIVKKSMSPPHFFKALQLHRNRNGMERTKKDSQLRLYAEFLESNFICYGYFENPNYDPEDISFSCIKKAQYDYALNIVEHVKDQNRPVLDIGCGIGGLSLILEERGFHPISLTPDEFQIKHIEENHPQLTTEHCRFEDLDKSKYEDKIGTITNSESLQYLNLDKSLPLINSVLTKNGRWIISDYFRKKEDTYEKSGHLWDVFQEKLDQSGFQIVFEKDITKNVAPCLHYFQMLGTRIGRPLLDFTIDKFKVKSPGLHYLAEELVESARKGMERNLEIINPDRFMREKKYMLLVVERKA